MFAPPANASNYFFELRFKAGENRHKVERRETTPAVAQEIIFIYEFGLAGCGNPADEL